MGFMDKAKKLAEQAQQKLDEAQKNFNQSGSPQAQPDEGGTRYDEHGRPIQDAPPAGATPPPSAQPADPTSPIADPAAPTAPAADTPASPAAPVAPAAGPDAPAPPADPASPSPPPDPASESDPGDTERHPAGPEPTRQPETPESGAGGQPNQAPDPFKPLQQ
jgi:hypothetical protein